ncbi:MAG: hypothetical protein QM763_00270 [Agriterribacter sp.]
MNTRNLLLIFIINIFYIQAKAQISPLPWKPEQMLAPASLAAVVKSDNTQKPLVISVGPSGLIRGAINIGPPGKKQMQKV